MTKLTQSERQELYSLIEFKLVELKDGDFCDSKEEEKELTDIFSSIQSKLFNNPNI